MQTVKSISCLIVMMFFYKVIGFVGTWLLLILGILLLAFYGRVIKKRPLRKV